MQFKKINQNNTDDNLIQKGLRVSHRSERTRNLNLNGKKSEPQN